MTNVIKIFWSIELNDLWSKKISTPKGTCQNVLAD